MPLPIILGAAAAAAGLVGIGSGIGGIVKMTEASDIKKQAEKLHEENMSFFEKQNKITSADMDVLGRTELKILHSFTEFSNVYEKIHNRPEFKEYQRNNIQIPKFTLKEIEDVSVGAGVLLGGIGGAAIGTAGGFAAAGATTAAVMALGTASTGTAIASLSGAAATNAALAALGGGALSAGGGGMALGSTVLGGATAGVGLLIGGIIFNLVGDSISEKADQAYEQVREEREKVNEICEYLSELSGVAKKYLKSMQGVYEIYRKQLQALSYIVDKKINWRDFSQKEKLITENTVLLVGLLYNMGKVKLVLQSDNKEQVNKVNRYKVQKVIDDTNEVLIEKGLLLSGHLDLDKVKESIRSKLTENEYYMWIDSLQMKVSNNSIRVIASDKETAQYVKNYYSVYIERALFNYFQRSVAISYGFIQRN